MTQSEFSDGHSLGPVRRHPHQVTPLGDRQGGVGLLRVLVVVHDPDLHGAQRALLTLLRGVDSRRFECHVVVPFDGPIVAEVSALGHRVHFRPMVRWVPAERKVQRVGLLRYLLVCFGGVRRRASTIAGLIGRLGIDMVLTNSIACVEGALAARMAGVPHVWHIHESIAGNRALRGILPAFVYRAVVSMLSRQVVFVSNSVAVSHGRLRHRGVVVHPGIAVADPVDRHAARRALLHRLGAQDSAQLVGIVGSLQPGKGHSSFLAAASLMHRRRADLRFLIVGTGAAEHVHEIEASAQALGLSEYTTLTGWWPPSEISQLMAGLDVLVIASLQESFGLTAIEALAVETPVVSTRCGGPAEVIRDGVDGRLVPVGDADAMARAIEATLSDPAGSRAQARSGRERVAEQFSQERYVQAMARLFEACTHRLSATASTPSPSGP